jgi:hypothetical protein
VQETAAVASTDDVDQPVPSTGADDEDETVAKSLTEATSQLAMSALKSDAPLHVPVGQVSPLHFRRNSVSDVPTVVKAAVAMPTRRHFQRRHFQTKPAFMPFPDGFRRKSGGPKCLGTLTQAATVDELVKTAIIPIGCQEQAVGPALAVCSASTAMRTLVSTVANVA